MNAIRCTPVGFQKAFQLIPRLYETPSLWCSQDPGIIISKFSIYSNYVGARSAQQVPLRLRRRRENLSTRLRQRCGRYDNQEICEPYTPYIYPTHVYTFLPHTKLLIIRTYVSEGNFPPPLTNKTIPKFIKHIVATAQMWLNEQYNSLMNKNPMAIHFHFVSLSDFLISHHVNDVASFHLKN